MAKFEDFSIDPNKTYVLMNSQSKFGTGARITNAGDGQYLAIAFDAATRKFVAIPFTHFEESAVPATGSATARPQGTFQGSNIFIVRHINPELGLRPNLSAELDAWKDRVKFNLAKPLVRDTSFGQLLIDIQKLFKEQLTEQKRLLDEQAAAAPTQAAPEPAPAQSAQTTERPASIIPAAREVLEPRDVPPARGQAYVSGQDFDDEDLQGVDVPQSNRIKGRLEKDFERGFTYVSHGTNANGGRPIFLHISQCGNLQLRGGSEIEFELIDGNKPGSIQAGYVTRPGEGRIPAQRAEDTRDPRSLPPIREDYGADDRYEQPYSGDPYTGERDERGRIIIPDAWYEPDFKREIVAGGAPRPVRSDDSITRRRGPADDEPQRS